MPLPAMLPQQQETQPLQKTSRHHLKKIPGGGLDARAQRGVSPSLLSKSKLIIAVTLAFVLYGMVAVTISAKTTSLLSENANLAAKTQQQKTQVDSLLIEKSLMCQSSRIERIATQNYHMVPATEFVSITPAKPKPQPVNAALSTDVGISYVQDAETGFSNHFVSEVSVGETE